MSFIFSYYYFCITVVPRGTVHTNIKRQPLCPITFTPNRQERQRLGGETDPEKGNNSPKVTQHVSSRTRNRTRVLVLTSGAPKFHPSSQVPVQSNEPHCLPRCFSAPQNIAPFMASKRREPTHPDAVKQQEKMRETLESRQVLLPGIPCIHIKEKRSLGRCRYSG